MRAIVTVGVDAANGKPSELASAAYGARAAFLGAKGSLQAMHHPPFHYTWEWLTNVANAHANFNKSNRPVVDKDTLLNFPRRAYLQRVALLFMLIFALSLALPLITGGTFSAFGLAIAFVDSLVLAIIVAFPLTRKIRRGPPA